MNPKRLTLSVSLPALLFAGGMYLGKQGPKQAPVNLQGAVAVVDIDACLLGYPPGIARRQQLTKTRDLWQQDIKSMTAKGKELTGELILLLQGSEAWWDKKGEIETLKGQLNRKADRYEIQFQILWDEMRVALFSKISRGIAAYAAKSGHQLILRKRSPKAGQGVRETVQSDAMLDVLFAAPVLDVTPKVTKFLKGWKPKGKPKPKAP